MGEHPRPSGWEKLSDILYTRIVSDEARSWLTVMLSPNARARTWTWDYWQDSPGWCRGSSVFWNTPEEAMEAADQAMGLA